MLSRISPIYENSLYMKTFMQSTGIEWDELRAYVETLRQQHFIETVDWGIEYMERKYSVEPDPTLTLEQRRARLGIKAYRKYPLNPAVLEAYARDHFDLNIFLDESDAGYIHLLTNHGGERLGDFIDYLAEEKPAHLALRAMIYLVDYIGGGGIDDDDSLKIFVPQDFPIRGDSDRLQYFDPDLIPLTEADKKRFPRLFVGLVDLKVGTKTIALPKPADFVQRIYAGAADTRVGDRTIELARPKGFTRRAYVGQVVIRGGSRTINADLSDLPTYDDLIESGIADLLIADVGIARPGRIQMPVEHFDEVLKLPLYAGVVETRNGSREIGLARPPDQLIKLHAGLVEVKRGERVINIDTNRNVVGKNILRVGQVIFRTGSRIINTSDDIPEVTHRIRARGEKHLLHVGNALGRFGNRTVGYGNRTHSEYKLLKMHAGQIRTRTGSRIIAAEDDLFNVPDGDWLKLFFDYPTTRAKEVTLSNPRPDLVKADIRQVGDLAAADKILINALDETTTGITRAALITRTEKKIF